MGGVAHVRKRNPPLPPAVLADALQDPISCVWTADEDGVWVASCGARRSLTFEFNADGPTENQFTYCPYCGHTIKAVPFDEMTGLLT
jgi:hypothetical protein